MSFTLQAQCNHQDDYTALRALYLSTNGDNWTNTTGWPTSAEFNANPTVPAGTDLSGWYGVQCDDKGRVSCIDLDGDANCTEAFNGGNNLVGALPSEIGNLSNLTWLNLAVNQLNGNIPVEFGNLSNLTRLYLSRNNLSGSIPAELGNLNNLTRLYLNANQLSGSIPVEFGNLSNLTRLYLNVNQLSGSIPVELGNLSKLTRLTLMYNQLSGSIPVELGNLSNLTVLNLAYNQLSGSIPAELGNLSKLTFLYLNNNQLSGNILEEMGDLVNLTRFWLKDNQLSGCIPSSLHDIICGISDKDFSNNPLLPWQGDVAQFCATDGSQEAQKGAPCDDGDASNGTSDVILDDCSCGHISCTLTIEGSSFVCDDNGTPSDPTDDIITVSVNASAVNGGVSNSFNVSDGTTTHGPFTYGVVSTFTLSADGSTSTLVYSDADDATCTASVEIGPLESCSDACLLTIEESSFVCDDNGTPSDPIDDIITVSVNASAVNGGVSNSFNVIDGTTTHGPFTYGVVSTFTLSADGSTLTLVYSDADDATCSASVDIGPLESCSDACLLTIEESSFVCSDNGTPSDPSDDIITVSVNASAVNGGVSNSFNVSDGTNTLGTFTYGTVSTFTLPAVGSTLTLVYTDADDATCSATVEIGPLESCSDNCGIHPDYAPLMALYNSTNGADWTNNTGWKDGADSTNCDPCDGWYGVYCQGGRVDSLGLSANNLVGQIPPELGELSLDGLNLSINTLSGPIPTEITKLDKLTWILLHTNNLSSCIDLSVKDFLCLTGYAKLYNNPLLPWEGNLSQICATDGSQAAQEGAPCDDGDDSNGTSDTIVDCLCQGTVSTSDTEQNKLVVYPNPASTKIYIENMESAPYRLIDLYGRTIQTGKYNGAIDISEMVVGTYLLKVYQHDIWLSKYIIIAR